MVFTITTKTELPPDPPPQQAELMQDHVMSQYNNNTYLQPFNTTYQQVTPPGQTYVQPTDGMMYNGDTGHTVPTLYTLDPFPCAPYDCSNPVTPQHQMYSCVSEPTSDFTTTTTNPFTASHSQYEINNVLPSSLPGAETNPFLPQSEICDNVSSNPFHAFSANDPTFPDSTPTSSTTDSFNTITENEFVTDLGITDKQSSYSNDHNPSQQMPLDASNADDNSTVNQVYNVDNFEYQKEALDEQYDHSAKNGSADDISMNSASDVYNSTYTDTISSVDSAQYLIKPTNSDDDVSQEEPVKEIYLNDGYVSGSSTEVLNENDDTNSEEDATKFEDDSEDKPLLGDKDVDSVGEQKEENEPTESGKEPEDPVQQIEEFVHHHLFPIAENEVITIDIEEIETPTSSYLPIPPSPKLSSFPYGKITNNLTVADESFLFQSQTSLWDLNTNKQGMRAATMQNLHERSSFLNLTEVARIGRACQKALIYLKDDLTFGSLISLNAMAAKNFQDPSQAVSLIEEDKKIDIIASTKHRKNLLALSVCISLLFISMGSVRNLQSSLNQEGGVGIISMAVSFAGYMVGSIFSSSIVQNFQPRKCIIISLIPNLMFVAANIYPTVWLMGPVSLLQGVALAIIWNAMSTYITLLSRGRAQKRNESFERVSNNFFGIFCLFYQSYHIIGNVIASLVLMPSGSAAGPAISNSSLLMNTTNVADVATISPGSQEGILFEMNAPVPLAFEVDGIPAPAQGNETLSDVTHLRFCGAEFCNHYEIGGSGVAVSNETKYLLFGIYMACIVVAMLIAMFLLEPLNPRLFTSTVSPVQKMKRQLTSLIKFTADKNFLLLFPLMVYTFMQFGFVTGEVTMAFITCPLGIHMVGYTMVCYGICGSLSSYISGLLSKCTGRMPLILTAKKSLQSLTMGAQELTVRFISSNSSVIMSDRVCEETALVCLT